jgi:exodeoxyribonuclease VII large subunit
VRADAAGRKAVVTGARALVAYSRAPLYRLGEHRTHLHQKARELRAAARRGRDTRVDYQRRVAANVIARKRAAAVAAVGSARAVELRGAAASLERAQRALADGRRQALAARRTALSAHDPERALERGYALLVDGSGEPLVSAAAVRSAKTFDARLADGTIRARVDHDQDRRDP